MGIFGKQNAKHQGDLVEQHQAEKELMLDVGELEEVKSMAVTKMHELDPDACVGLLEMILKTRPIITRFVWYFTEEFDREKKVRLPNVDALLHKPRKEIAHTLYNLFAMDDNVVGVDWIPGQAFITVWLGTREEDPCSHIEIASQDYY